MISAMTVLLLLAAVAAAGVRRATRGPAAAGPLRLRPALPMLGLLALASTGCRAPAEPRPVVLVSIDTLRADHLGLYGYRRPTSPRMDALAGESVVFDNAVPTCPATAPSMASLLTGLHRASHQVVQNGSRLPATVETLAEILRANGYRTAASIANPVLDAPLGFAQGFDEFSAAPATRGAGGGPGVVEEARRLLDGLVGSPRFFLWLHFVEPHGPYRPPEAYRALFRPEDYVIAGEADLPLSADNSGLLIIPRYQAVDAQRAPADYRARYDAAIRYTDDRVAAVVGALRERGLWDRSLFVLTADHGESLGEHRYYFQHGWFAYQDCVRVPLLLRAPDLVPRGRRVAESVSLVDVPPTILELVGLSAPKPMEGRSLVPLIRARDSADRPAFIQTYYGEGLVALRLGSLEYIFTPPGERAAGMVAHLPPPGPREELYDVVADPGETRDLSASRADDVERLRARVKEWLGAQEERGRRMIQAVSSDQRGATAPDPALERQLRALGYVN